MPNYVTKERLEQLQKQLEGLKGPKRREIARRIEDAISLGDLSENAEYHEARNEQAFNEGKIQELEGLIRDAEVIKESDHKTTKATVEIGDHVEVERNGERITFTIVGSADANPAEQKISNESPLGRKLMNRGPGEEVSVPTPNNGTVTYRVVRIT